MTKKSIINRIKSTPAITAFVLIFAVIGTSILVFTKAATPNTAAPVTSLATGNASFSLSPASGSNAVSTNFTLSIYEDIGTDPAGVASVDARLSYDAAKLTFVSVANTGGAFTNCFESTGGNGSVALVCSQLNGTFPKGKQKVGEVVFTAKAGSGTATVTFANTSHIYKADGVPTDIWDGVTTGGTYTLTTPGSGGGGGGGGGGTTTPPATGGSGSGSTKPSTSGGSTSKTGSSNNSGSNNNPSTGNPTTGGQAQSTATTYPVTVTVTDKDGNAVAGAKVTIDGQTAISDASGLATFAGLAAGKYKAKIETSDGTTTKDITVVASEGVQTFKAQFKKPIPYLLYGAIAVGVVVFFVVVRVVKNWLHERAEHDRRFNAGVHVGGEEPEPAPSISPSKPADPIVNETVATVVAPKAESDAGVSLAPAATKHDVNPNETLDKIEKKVSAKKEAPVKEVKEKMVSANEFTPNLIVPKKEKPLPPQAEKPA